MGAPNRAVTALTVAKLLSTTGSWMSTVALPWLVLTTTGSPARMSMVLAAQVAGIVLLGLPSGPLVARLGVRRTLLLGDAARAPLIAGIPILFHLDALAFPAILAISFTAGGFTASYVAAQRLAIPELVGTRPNAVAQANSLVDGATRVGNLVGPAIAGVLIAVVGAADVLWFDAATFLVSFFIVLVFVKITRRPASPPAPAAHQPAASRWTPAGVRYLASDRVLRWMAAALLLVGITYPLLMVVLPILTQVRFGGDPRTFGILVSANGLGLAVGSLLAIWLSGRWPIARLGGIAGVGAMAPLWLLLQPLTPSITAAVLAVSGIFIPTFSACLTSHFTLRPPDPVRPQVMTSVITAENLTGFAAYAAGGTLLTIAGIQPVLVIIAIVGTACTLSLLVAVKAVQDSARDISEAQGRQRFSDTTKVVAFVAILGAVGTFLTGLAATINVVR
jgi:MFS family permease